MLVLNEDVIINSEDAECEDGSACCAIVYVPDDEELYYLNETSLCIVEYCESARTMSEIYDYISEHFEMEENDKNTITDVINELIGCKILLEV